MSIDPALVVGAVTGGLPVALGFRAGRVGIVLLLANVTVTLMTAGFALKGLPEDFVAPFAFAGVFSQLVVIGVVTAWWQVEAWEVLADHEDEPTVFGRSHRYWDWTLPWSAYHVVKFHRLARRERAAREVETP